MRLIEKHELNHVAGEFDSDVGPTVSEVVVIGVKPGVDLSNLNLPVRAIIPVIVSVWTQFPGAPDPVVTSANDGRHREDSKHYTDDAIDLRGNNLSDANMKQIANELQRRIGSDYDVIAEYFPGSPSNEHIHIEYDPR